MKKLMLVLVLLSFATVGMASPVAASIYDGDGGGGCHWIRDADDYFYWVC